MRAYLIIITAFIINIANAQQYSGIIRDSTTNEPIPFVNIGIMNKGTGTVSQADGNFKLIIAHEFLADTIRISMIGYEKKMILVRDFIEANEYNFITINLQPDIQELNTIIVRPRNMKEIILGNTFDSPHIMAGFKTNDLGAEIETIMKVHDERTYYLKTAGFYIGKCLYDSILFRVNIYNIVDRKPGEILHTLPIYVKIVNGQTKLLIDLTPYNITVDDDFILSLEWIQDLSDKTTSLMFCAGFIGNRIFYKLTSQDKWSTFPIGIGSWCLAEYEK